MKKSHLIALLLLTATASVTTCYLAGRRTCSAEGKSPTVCADSPRQEERGGGPMHPGYHEQWLAMKGKDGQLPLEVMRQVRRQLAERKASHKSAGTSTLSLIDQLGPSNIGGRTRTIVVDKANSSRMIAGGVSGGLWLTTDKGTTWSAIDDQMLTLSVTSLTQDPNATSNWYCTTGEPRGNSAGIPGDGIFKSTDNGATWSQLASSLGPEFDYTWKIAIDPNTAGEIYVATKNEGLFRSTNGGTTWDQVHGTTGTDVSDVEVFPSGHVIIGVNGKGIYKSANGNPGTFVESTTGLPVSAFRRVELAYCQGTPSVVYAAIEDSVTSAYYTGLQDMYRSTDAGITWTDLANPDDDYGFFFSFPWYSMLLAVKPDDPDYVLCGVGDLAYSTDAGATWNTAYYSHADYHTATFDPSDANKVYVGNDGGIYRYSIPTISGGLLDRNNAYMVTQYYAGHFYPTLISALAGAQDNGTHQMYAGSAVCTEVFGGDGSYCAVNQQNDNISYVSYQYGQIYRADDSHSPTPGYYDVLFGSAMDNDSDGSVDDGCWFINPFEIHQGDGDQVYFVTHARIFRYDGSAWSPLTNSLAAKPYCVGIAHQDNDPTVYIGGEEGLFYRVNTAASAAPGSEVDLSASLPASVSDDFLGCLTVHPSDASIVYACFTNYENDPRIWRVENANTASPTWVDISGNLPAGLPVNWVEAHPHAPEDYLVAATDNGLWVSTDGGTTWNEETALPNVSIHQIRLRKTDLTLFIPTHGRGFWTAQLPNLLSTDAPMAGQPLQVWPNPASTDLHVQGGTSKLYEVLSISGQRLMGGALGLNAAVDVSGLPAGVYLLRVGDETRKFLKR